MRYNPHAAVPTRGRGTRERERGKRMTWIALLRGINVGGHTVTMARLRQLFAELGLANVRSYIQTGNVFFDGGEEERPALRRRLGAHHQAGLGKPVAVWLRTV